MKKYANITPKIINDIKETYLKYGSKTCVEKYKISDWKVRDILKKENIQPNYKCFKRSYRNQSYLNINADDFINMKSSYHAYILGLLWADGWLVYKHKKKEIRIQMTYEDGKSIESIFMNTGKWNTYFIKKDEFRKARYEYICNNAKFVDFLYDNDYKIKSQISPNKIWNKIPDEFKRYFLLGWADGDGCFYNNIKSNGRRIEFTIAGTYDQDWSCLEQIFLENNIKNYKIKRKIMKNGNKYSIVRILKQEDLIILGNFLYNHNKYEFGLKRKYDKFVEIYNYINRIKN